MHDVAQQISDSMKARRLPGLGIRIISDPMTWLKLKTATVACALWTGAALAHPHIFIDTRLVLHVDETGQAQGIEVSWTYDGLYSLLTMEDLGLDDDADGALTDEELEKLAGFDMNWVDGYEGDTFVIQDGQTIPLGPPEPRGVSVEEGLITSTHFRPFEATAAGLMIKAYDPTYYTAYSLAKGVSVNGPCLAEVVPANFDQAYTMLEELLYAKPASVFDDNFPAVGEAFADTVTVTCD